MTTPHEQEREARERVEYSAGELEDWADLASNMISEVTNPDAENMLQAAALLFRGIAAFQANSEKICAPRIPHWKVNPIGMLHFLKGAKGKEMSLPAILAREACRTEEDAQRERYDNAMADYREAIIEAEFADSTRAISLLVEWMLMDGGHEVEVSRVGKYFTARLTAHDGAVTKFLGHGESLIGAIFDCHERSKQ